MKQFFMRSELGVWAWEKIGMTIGLFLCLLAFIVGAIAIPITAITKSILFTEFIAELIEEIAEWYGELFDA